MKKRRKYICGGYWENTPYGKDFDCYYESDWSCDECVINGGNKIPTGIKWVMEQKVRKANKIKEMANMEIAIKVVRQIEKRLTDKGGI